MKRNLYSDPVVKEIDLGWKIGLGVNLVEHCQRRDLREAQVLLLVGLVDSCGEGFIIAVGPDASPFFAILMAVPVSWQPGRMPFAAISAFFKNIKATMRSFPVASDHRGCQRPVPGAK